MKPVLVLMNPASGTGDAVEDIFGAARDHWEADGIGVSCELSHSIEDGREKLTRAADRGVDTVLLVGGDGMVNSSLKVLMERDLTLGIVPGGSLNALAKHVGAPLDPVEAVKAYRNAEPRRMDVGLANGHPWVVTCSFAWENAIAECFDQLPTRGMPSYFLSALRSSMDFEPQPHVVVTPDGVEEVHDNPMVLTAVNISDYAALRVLSSETRPDDGRVELVSIHKDDVPHVLSRLPKLLAGHIDEVPELACTHHERFTVRRERPGPIQIDGERVDTDAAVVLSVNRRALRVLYPRTEA